MKTTLSRFHPIVISLKRLPRLGLCAAALLLAGAASAGNLTGRYATINLDGNLSDWLPGDTLYSASEIGAGAPLSSTFTNVLVANDSNYLYVALQIPAPATINDPWTYNLYIDSDMSGGSGFNAGWMGAGYDHLVQYGAAGSSYSIFDFAGGAAQAGWSWNWNTLISYSYSDTLIEWAIPRSALGTATNKFRMEFNVTGDGTTGETWAYQWESGVGTYTLASPPDTKPPVIASVEAGANKVVVNFSKPMDTATAGVTTNYSLNGGLSVLSATPSSADPKEVVLATSAQTRGSVYVVNVNGVKATTGVAIAPQSQKAFVSSIVVDGSSDDWDGISPLFSNDQGSPTATDYQDVYVYNDADYVYFRLTLWEPSDLWSAQNNLFFDTDNDPATGNAFWGGAELLIEGGIGYQEKHGAFNEGLINGLEMVSANTGSTNYEFRISRKATYASDGLPVFTTNAINFAFEAENSWVTVNQMPSIHGTTIPYTLVDSAVAPLGPLTIAVGGGQTTISWTGAGTLQAAGSLTSGSWTNVPAASSPYTAPGGATELYFRLAQ